MKPTNKGMKYLYTEITILGFREARLFPWYTSEFCEAGCCFQRHFSWLFFRVRAVWSHKPLVVRG